MTQAPALFPLLPSGLFGPLASPNREHYWLLLCRLFDEFFGPDAPVPPSMGFQRREITAALERYLLADDPWEDEDGDTPDTPLPVRVNNIYDRFRGAGWLRQERVGARGMVTMPPVVHQFLSLLVEFAEHGPTFVSAKMRSRARVGAACNLIAPRAATYWLGWVWGVQIQRAIVSGDFNTR